MINTPQSIFLQISEFLSEGIPAENKAAFLSETVYVNFIRMRIMATAALTIFFFLWIWDISLLIDGKWAESIG
jgi:hypothetical protein